MVRPTEADDVRAVEDPCPERDGQGHEQVGDGGGDEDAGGVGARAKVEARGHCDHEDRNDHEVAEPKEEHEEHELGEAAVLAENKDGGREPTPRAHDAHGGDRSAFGDEERPFASDTQTGVEKQPDERDGGQRRREPVVTFKVVVHRGPDAQPEQGHADLCDDREASNERGAEVGGIVGAPDGGAKGDDAGPEDAGEDDQRESPPEPGGRNGHEGDCGYGKDQPELEGVDESDLGTGVAGGDPEKGNQIGHLSRAGGECDGQVVPAGVDEPGERFFDEHRDRAAFDERKGGGEKEHRRGFEDEGAAGKTGQALLERFSGHAMGR